MKIEKVEEKDLQEILELQKLAYKSEAEIYNDFTIPPMIQTLDEIKSDFLNQTYLKTTLNGKIIGSVRGYIENGICFIGRLIVHPDLHNQGIGTMLISKIETIFKNVGRFEIFTGHRSQKNLYLYEKLGYRRFKSEKINKNLSMIYLEKRL